MPELLLCDERPCPKCKTRQMIWLERTQRGVCPGGHEEIRRADYRRLHGED